MDAEIVQVKFSRIMQTRTYTVVILGTESKQFPIYMEPQVGKILQICLTEAEKPRPLTHDLLAETLDCLGVRFKQVVINDRQDTVYYARLFIEQEQMGRRQIIEIDARPSDCMALALLKHIPVYCTREVLDQAVSVEY